MAHTTDHDTDPNVAFDTVTGEIIDFCYDCDDFFATGTYSTA